MAVNLTNKESTKQTIKNGKNGTVIFWNKGNSLFRNKKDEIESMIQTHKPIMFGILEANIGPEENLSAHMISGYKLEVDNLYLMGNKSRTVLFMIDGLKYLRRTDLEVKKLTNNMGGG